MTKIWRIYRYYNPAEDKSYIGQTTKNTNERAGKNGHGYYRNSQFKQAIDNYGWDTFEQSILRLCTTQEEADFYEQYFIEKYNTIWPNGYNMYSGGHKNYTCCKLSKEKMSTSQKGKIMPEETKQRISKSLKGIIYSEERNRHISESLKGKSKSEEAKKHLSEIKKGQPSPKRKKILQLSKSGELIAEYQSISEAQKNLGIYNISEACSGHRPYAGGYIWKYA